MGELRCVDGSVLSVTAVACRDRAGQPFEITLSLARDSVPFASVGQRCGYQLAQLAGQLTDARLDPELAAAWPDPDDRFPAPAASVSATGVSATAVPATGVSVPSAGADAPATAAAMAASQLAGPGQLGSYLPGETEYFALRSRDRADLPGTGELRCVLRSSAVWIGDCAGTGAHGATDAAGLPGQHPWPRLPGQHVLPGQHLRPGQQQPASRPRRASLTRVRDGRAGPRSASRPPAAASGGYQAGSDRGVGCGRRRRTRCPDFG